MEENEGETGRDGVPWTPVQQQNPSSSGIEQGVLFWMRPCFKIPTSSTDTVVPAKYVSLHAEMVHRLLYIIYIFIAHSWGLFHRVTRPGSNTQRLTALS